MNFVDRTLVRIADPSARAAVFEGSLEGLLDVAYDTTSMPVDGPFSAIFERVDLVPAPPREATVEGSWGSPGMPGGSDARFLVTGIGIGATARVDAVWRGAIVARMVPPTGEIIEVDARTIDLGGVDEDIITDLGALPADEAALEVQRRARLRERLAASVGPNATITDRALDAWLEQFGASSAADLLGGQAGMDAGVGVRVRYAPPGVAQPQPLPLPFVAVLLIRDAGFAVADLLAESASARQWTASMALDRPVPATLPVRNAVPVVWVVPIEVFDDDGWPGAAAGNANERRRLRRAAAAAWLAREGIGLVTVG
jgi:hypothetical protein